MMLLKLLLLVLSLNEWDHWPFSYVRGSVLTDIKLDVFPPEISPELAPQPFLPLFAPSPLTPFTNSTVPKLSGVCSLNFTAAESLMSITSIDCFSFFAPLLANVICCPQFEATIAILIGQYSKESNMLALNGTSSKYCLSDIEQILVGQGAELDVKNVCSIHQSNLTEGSCPVKDVNEFESTVNSEKLLSACEKVDPVKECCEQICQNAILEAATKIALKTSGDLSLVGAHGLPEQSTKISDCKNIVLRWLASKLGSSRAKEVLRALSNCNVNKVCPLHFPDMSHVAKGCGSGNWTGCCSAMESYISHLQKQRLVTNLQALDCATTLGFKLQRSNITRDVYSLCHITLKDFSLQIQREGQTFDPASNRNAFRCKVDSFESGCLLPSLPSDATFDQYTGVSFICDLNDNIPAPWPSSSQSASSSCKKTLKMPALPAAASAQNGLYREVSLLHVLLTGAMVVVMLLWM